MKTIPSRRQFRDLGVKVQASLERSNLFQQPIDKLLGIANWNRRDVVDGLVGVQFGALAAGGGQRIDHVRAKAEQA